MSSMCIPPCSSFQGPRGPSQARESSQSAVRGSAQIYSDVKLCLCGKRSEQLKFNHMRRNMLTSSTSARLLATRTMLPW